jgi:subtilisin family serine protease
VLACNGSGSTSGVIAGVDWVTANHRSPAVANMSLGGGASTALDTAVRNSIASGVTYAIAAGNSNVNAANQSPARVTEAITVGATTMSDARSSFSNFGSVVDIFAPGSAILSAWNTSDTATNTISGTSMATPHVAGVVARFLQTNPGASPATARNAIVGAATLNRLSGIPTGTANRLLFWSSAQ